MKSKFQVLIAASALFMVCAVGAQQAPPAKTTPAKPKAKKVWTNDEVTNLRQPSDDYAEAKRKQAEEAAKQKAEAEKAVTPSPADKEEDKPKDFLPKTVEDAEKLLAAKQYEISQQYESIDLVKKELAEATTDEARTAIQKKIDALTALLDEAVAEMKTVDVRLQELKAKPPAPAKPAPPKP